MKEKRHRITIRLDSDELEIVKNKATDLNMSNSEFIRQMILNYSPSVKSNINNVELRILYIILQLYFKEKIDLERNDPSLLESITKEAKQKLAEWGYYNLTQSN